MFQYLEDFTTSTHISPDAILGESTTRQDSAADDDESNINIKERKNSELEENTCNYLQPWYVYPMEGGGRSSSRSSSISFGKNHHYFYSSTPSISISSATRTSSPPTAIAKQVEMELIAVICMSNDTPGSNYLSVNNRAGNKRSGLGGYSVYCKAGKDKVKVNQPGDDDDDDDNDEET